MKTLLSIVLLASTFQNPQQIPIKPLDWRFEAQICGNIMTDESGILRARLQVWQQGCHDVQVVPVTDGAYLVYGVKVVRTTDY